jgi:hypothetical protein
MFGRRRATGILPVPEHGQDGHGTPPVASISDRGSAVGDRRYNEPRVVH